jgi:hypothetical protein
LYTNRDAFLFRDTAPCSGPGGGTFKFGGLGLRATMGSSAREIAIDTLSELGSVLCEGDPRYGPVIEVDLGRGASLVTDDILTHLRHIPEVKHLFVDKTFVTNKIMEVFQFCPEIKAFTIEDTQVTDKGLENLKYATAMDRLYIGFRYPEWPNPITDVGFVHVKLLTSLTHLVIPNTLVTARGLQSISDLKKIESLMLSPRQVGDACVPVLCGLPVLNNIQLADGYPLTGPLIDLEPTAEFLRNALPNVNVWY